MLRFFVVILLRIFSIIYFVPKMAYYARHPERYSEEACYALAQTVIGKVKKTARTTTHHFGKENLPAEGGYILFSNHQGKYDALGILSGHEKPCSVLMDDKRSKMLIAKQFVDLLRGQRIPKDSPKGQIRTLNAIADEVRQGRRYLVFPEGGYRKDQDNRTNEFKYGCFLCALKAKCPIVPVAIIDSYKPFGTNSLKPVETQCVFLPPIPYETYQDMKAPEISAMVKEMIDGEIARRTGKVV